MLQGLFSIAILLSAFLLFFVQPVLAKYMIPLFGGSSFVWVTSLLFFQGALLIGYTYAYLLTTCFTEKKQAVIHFILLLCSFYFIPIQLHATTVFNTAWPPLEVINILTSSVLIPFVVLSASSPLMQHWYCTLKKTTYPYFFYSISNAGSLLGLLGYPLLLEPFMGTQRQSLLCSIIYVMYAILCALCLFKLRSANTIIERVQEKGTTTHFGIIVKWLILTFLTSALLLSTTQFLAQNVINAPLIWILPLTVYLISFISTFSTPKGYERKFWFPIFCIFTILMLKNIYLLTLNGLQVVIFLLGLLFSACIICHGELIRLKPRQKDLTLFYLIIALGSVLGGLCANGLSLLFIQWWNFYLPIFIISVMIIFISLYGYQKSLKKRNIVIAILSTFTLILLCIILWHDEYSQRDKKLVTEQRNLYGLLRVYDVPSKLGYNYRMLMHGTVVHGLEYLSPDKKSWPTMYYGPTSGAGLAIRFMHENIHHPLNIAVVGLGAGTIATLAHPNDNITFYEIDPNVVNIAHQYFHFLDASSSKNKTVLGDARIQLTKVHKSSVPPIYDVIVIDAFNGDAIPFHLITKEALELYRTLLKPHGIIAFHTSNSFINLMPITKGLAIEQDAEHFWIDSQADTKNMTNSTWGVLSYNRQFGAWLEHQNGFHLVPNNTLSITHNF